MFELQTFALFLAAATVVAVTPGPGIFYIVARTLASGRTEGSASSVGLGLGGFVHLGPGDGERGSVHCAEDRRRALSHLARHQDLEGSASPRAGRSSDDGAGRALPKRHPRESKDGRVLPGLYSAVRRHERERGAAVRCARHDFRRLEHCVDLIVPRWAAKARDRLAGRPTGPYIGISDPVVGEQRCTEQGRVARISSRHTYKGAYVMAKRCVLVPTRSHGGSAQISDC